MINKEKNDNNKKKLITFSRQNYDLLDGFIRDKATVSGTNYSAVIEKIILKEFSPETLSKKASYYIRMIYEKGLKETYIEIFQEIDARFCVRAVPNNIFQITKFAMEILTVNSTIIGIDPDYDYLYETHFKEYKELIKRKLESTLDEKLLLFKEDQYDSFSAYDYFWIVLNYWNELEKYPYTFRLLCDIISLSPPQIWNVPEHRLKAIQLISKEITSEWDNY